MIIGNEQMEVKASALRIAVPMSADDVRRVQDEGLALFRRKNADYGNAYRHYGTVGVIVRMGDKIKRLSSITSREVRLVDDETLRDTLLDLHNYAAMAIALLDEDRKPAITIPNDGDTLAPHAPPAPTHKRIIELQKKRGDIDHRAPEGFPTNAFV
tara:strand:- start:332 stop:799 length:468 start_codon:yes stop_codon:yes gene_type:complete